MRMDLQPKGIAAPPGSYPQVCCGPRVYRTECETGQYTRKCGGGQPSTWTARMSSARAQAWPSTGHFRPCFFPICYKQNPESIQRPQVALCSRTTAKYQEEIVRPSIKHSAPAVGRGFLLVHVNAQPFVAGVCQQFRNDEGIDSITGPIVQQTWSTSVTSCIIPLSPQSTREWAEDHPIPWLSSGTRFPTRTREVRLNRHLEKDTSERKVREFGWKRKKK